MLSPVFEFFEAVCEELSSRAVRVLTSDDFSLERIDGVIDALKYDFNETSGEAAIEGAVEALGEHFLSKGSGLPFRYNPATGQFFAEDEEFIQFIAGMRSIRSVGAKSKEFEVSASRLLSGRVTGLVHRTGWPRDNAVSVVDFRGHLQNLGFQRSVALGNDKDGGLDIIWLPPLGTVPHRPIVSVQCKNSFYELREALQSLGVTETSLGCHRGLQVTVHFCCVLFNDYITPDLLIEKPFKFVPLGLSDLASLGNPIETVVL